MKLSEQCGNEKLEKQKSKTIYIYIEKWPRRFDLLFPFEDLRWLPSNFRKMI